MREFKFRVFDRLTNEMIEVNTLVWGPHQINKFIGRTGDSGGWHNVHKGFLNEKGYFNGSKTRIKRYVLMQNTGLKDKNGAEVYEGDIYKDSLGRVYEVEFDEFRCGFTPFAKDDGCGCCSDEVVAWGDEGEIIGNIYEHHHLLKE